MSTTKSFASSSRFISVSNILRIYVFSNLFSLCQSWPVYIILGSPGSLSPTTPIEPEVLLASVLVVLFISCRDLGNKMSFVFPGYYVRITLFHLEFNRAIVRASDGSALVVIYVTNKHTDSSVDCLQMIFVLIRSGK